MAIVATVVLLIIRPWSARRVYLGVTAVALAADNLGGVGHGNLPAPRCG